MLSAQSKDPGNSNRYNLQTLNFRYTRNLVDAGNGKFNLMVLCWGEGHASSIHDHANAHCFMKMLAGNLCEMRYKWPENVENDVGSAMVELSRSGIATDDVCYINGKTKRHFLFRIFVIS